MGLSTFTLLKHVQPSKELSELNDKQLEDLHGCLELLVADVLDFCQEHNLACFAIGGSALGAVRHHGWIPWDDDFDLAMPRKDYNEFMRSFAAERGDEYWVHVPGKTRGYCQMLGKVKRKGTSLRIIGDLPHEDGIFLDIFILENTYDSWILRSLHGVVAYAFGLFVSCRRFYDQRESYMRLAKGSDVIERAVKAKVRIGRLLAIKSVEWWAGAADAWNSRCKNDSSKYVTIPAARKHFFGELGPREHFLPVAWLSYNDMKVPVPADTDSYLRRQYGDDYMVPPPHSERERHVVYRFDVGVLRDRLGKSERAM